MSSSRRKRVNAGQTATRTLETLVHRLKPIRRTLGRREVQRVTPDTCAKVGHDLGSSAFIALRRVLSFAVRRGYLATNPCEALERGERPSAKSGEVTVLTGDELHRLLDYADDATRPLIATAALSGLRQSELLALRWHDLDFESGVIRLRYQLSRGSANAPATLVPLNTDSSAREVVLVPALATILREHRAKAMKSGHHGADAYVFSTRNGTALSQRNATRSLALLAQRGSQASATTRSGTASRARSWWSCGSTPWSSRDNSATRGPRSRSTGTHTCSIGLGTRTTFASDSRRLGSWRRSQASVTNRHRA